MLSNWFNTFFGEADFDAPDDDQFQQAAVADLLPYRVFDPEAGIYYNDASFGFMVEVNPQVMTDELVGNLHAAIGSQMPKSGGFQVVNWSSPNISGLLNEWAATRWTDDGVVAAMSEKRVAYFQDLRFGSDDVVKAIPLNRRVIVAGWMEGDTSMSAVSQLQDYRRAVLTALGKGPSETLRPSELLSLLSEILHAEQWGEYNSDMYTPDLPLNAQVPGAALKVGQEHLEFGGSPKVSMTAASVARYPDEWDDMFGLAMFGHPDRIADRPHGPLLTSLSAVSIPSQKVSADLISQRGKMEHSAKTGFAKFVPDFAGKQKEFDDLAREIEGGERLLQTMLTVVAYTKGGRDKTRAAGAEMGKIYRRLGISLRQEKYLQLPILMGSLPMGMTEKHLKTFGKLQRMRLLKGRALAALAPMHGEWKGNTGGQGMLLMGRQGQILRWSNFISDGNYNTAVVGKSGAGKSVFMQELVTSIYANGGRVLVIDDGYSFKTTCEILGGNHVAFDGSVALRLNPFTMLQADKMETAYAAEAIELITNVIATMASLGQQREGRVLGIEEGAITLAVREVWDAKGNAGEITDVYDLLVARSEQDPRLIDVCAKLKTYTREGQYGRYFEGVANVTVDAAFTVVELSDLKSQPGLEQVVLQIIMFLGTELMYKTDRSVPVAIMIDEAWDLLKGEGTAKFIEGVVRRARKYTGALITGTQSIDDYYQNPAAEVCLQNSDWTVFLAQKPETIERLADAKRLSVTGGIAQRLKSITSVAGQFSEMGIKGPHGWSFARLVLDRFSLAVYSSKGSTVENLNRRRAAGMTTVEALNDMVEKGDVA